MESAVSGDRRVVAVVFAGATFAVLVVGAAVAMFRDAGLSAQALGVMVVMLGLHAAALRGAVGRSPWGDIERAGGRLGPGARQPKE